MSKKNSKIKIKQTNKENSIGPPYTNITLDTCIYRKFRYNFNNKILMILNDVSPIEVIIPNIVYYEVIKDLHEKNDHVSVKVKEALNEAKKWHFIDKELKFDLEIDPTQKWEDYLKLIDCQRIPSKHTNIATITKAYVEATSPFDKFKNKNEFPDAVALFSLEKWAEENDKRILAISEDKSWLAFSESSKYIDVISDLETGLNQALQTSGKTEIWVQDFISEIHTTTYDQLRTQIDDILAEKITIQSDTADFEVDNMPMNLEDLTTVNISTISYEYDSLSFPSADELELNVSTYNSNATSFIVSGIIAVYAEAKLNFNSDGKIYDESVKVDRVEIPIKLLFIFGGDINQKDYDPTIIDIGIVEPLKIPFENF